MAVRDRRCSAVLGGDVIYRGTRANLPAAIFPPYNAPEPAPHRSARREPRFSAEFPVLVCGFGVNGRLFSELASTHNISRSGCCIQLSTQPQPESSMAVRMTAPRGAEPGSVLQVLFEVVWLLPHGHGWIAGASVLDNSDLHALVFPSPTP